MSQTPRENNISDLSSVTNILWVFHQKSRQCCIARWSARTIPNLNPIPIPNLQAPLLRGLQNETVVIMGKVPRGLHGGWGNLKQDAPGADRKRKSLPMACQGFSSLHFHPCDTAAHTLPQPSPVDLMKSLLAGRKESVTK